MWNKPITGMPKLVIYFVIALEIFVIATILIRIVLS